MKSYVAPEFVFDRSPNKLDDIARKFKLVAALARAARASEETPAPPELQQMYRSDEDLKTRGLAFTERWRDILGDRLNDGVTLKSTSLPYTIEATIRKDDDLPRIEETQHQYASFMDIVVTQASGRASRFEYSSRTVLMEEGLEYPEGIEPVVYSNFVAPCHEDGRINNEGWGTYTYTESAQLNEVVIRVMTELDREYANGDLEISDIPADSGKSIKSFWFH